MNQIRVLHHLRKQETFLHIFKRAAIRSINVRDGREPLTDSGRCVYGEEGIPCPILVHRVAFSAISRFALIPMVVMNALPVIL